MRSAKIFAIAPILKRQDPVQRVECIVPNSIVVVLVGFELAAAVSLMGIVVATSRESNASTARASNGFVCIVNSNGSNRLCVCYSPGRLCAAEMGDKSKVKFMEFKVINE